MELEKNRIKNNLFNGYDGGWVYWWSIQSTVSMSTRIGIYYFHFVIDSSFYIVLACVCVCVAVWHAMCTMWNTRTKIDEYVLNIHTHYTPRHTDWRTNNSIIQSVSIHTLAHTYTNSYSHMFALI